MHIILMAAKEGVPIPLASIPEQDLPAMLMALHKTAVRELLTRCPWRDLTLSARATHVLERHQINSMDELIGLTPTRLQSLQGCGRRSCDEIQSALAAVGLSLRSERGEA
jgi:DNA-directed RNA polymerase subunit alpha